MVMYTVKSKEIPLLPLHRRWGRNPPARVELKPLTCGYVVFRGAAQGWNSWHAGGTPDAGMFR